MITAKRRRMLFCLGSGSLARAPGAPTPLAPGTAAETKRTAALGPDVPSMAWNRAI